MSEQPFLPQSASPAPAQPPPLPVSTESVPPPITYRVEHVTTYRYAQPITRDYGRAHIEPRATVSQRVLSHAVSVSPEPSMISAHTDFYGNSSTFFLVDAPHSRLEVRSRAQVEVSPRTYGAAQLQQPWELCVHDTWGPLVPLENHDFHLESSRVRITREIREIAAEVFAPGRPIGEALAHLTHRIHRDFTYASGATTVSSTLEEVLQARHGVCQDFSHVGLAVARSVGLGARYVSGYLRTAWGPTDHGSARGGSMGDGMVGDAASHAWLSVLVPGAGWVDIDPTNNTFADQRFVTTAWGRDYDDVPPLRGIIVGPPGVGSELSVSVEVTPHGTEAARR